MKLKDLFENQMTIRDKVCAVIRDYLKADFGIEFWSPMFQGGFSLDEHGFDIRVYVEDDYLFIDHFAVPNQSKGVGSKIIDLIVSNLPKGYAIRLTDYNTPKNGIGTPNFWNKMEDKYPSVEWQIQNRLGKAKE